MSKPLLVRCGTILAVLSIIIALSCGACARAFFSDAVGKGTLVVWLSGLDFAASIAGEILITGEAELGEESVSFSAEGTFCGFGVRGIVTLISEGWIGYAAAGRTVDDETIEIRGFLYMKWKSLIPLQAGYVLVGAQHAVLLFRGESHSFCGKFSGTVEGALEVSGTPGTIQLGGTGTVHMDGEPGGLPAAILLDHPALPAEFLQYVAELGLAI